MHVQPRAHCRRSVDRRLARLRNLHLSWGGQRKDHLRSRVSQLSWVIRARVTSADDHWADEGESWTLYHLKVVHGFKGKLLKSFTFFTERNSGGFYMDGNDANPDLGGDYLLFLVPLPHSTVPPAARGALWVNYNCGQSKPWSEASNAEIRRLRSLSLAAHSRFPLTRDISSGTVLQAERFRSWR